MTKVPIAVSTDSETNASDADAGDESAAESRAAAHADTEADQAAEADGEQAEGADAKDASGTGEAQANADGSQDEESGAQAQPAAAETDEATGNNAQASDAAAKAALDELQQERDKAREALLRTTADFDNFRKRTRRELEEAKMRGKDDAVRELLPIFDNLERAVQASENATDVTSVVEGVRMVLKLFDDTAQRMGLNRVPGVGKRFDPAVHEAIQQVETDEHAPGTIVTEVAAGYMFGQRLIRAGMVVVAKAAAPKPEASGPAEGSPEAADAENSEPEAES